MQQLGSPQPGLPSPPASNNTGGLLVWAGAMVRSLTSIITSITFALNKQPLCPSFTVATRPDVADWVGRVIFVTDGAAGAVFQASNGTAWVNLG